MLEKMGLGQGSAGGSRETEKHQKGKRRGPAPQLHLPRASVEPLGSSVQQKRRPFVALPRSCCCQVHRCVGGILSCGRGIVARLRSQSAKTCRWLTHDPNVESRALRSRCGQMLTCRERTDDTDRTGQDETGRVCAHGRAAELSMRMGGCPLLIPGRADGVFPNPGPLPSIVQAAVGQSRRRARPQWQLRLQRQTLIWRIPAQDYIVLYNPSSVLRYVQS